MNSIFRDLFIALIALLLIACTQSEQKSHTNIVFILADDLGWNQVGYHGMDFYETTNIDKIAAQGMYFTNAYSSAPVCSPTRGALMTGKAPARLHLTDYIPGSPYPYAPLTTPQQAACLPMEEVTIAEKLKENGYITGHFGKWHLSPDKEYQAGREFDPGSQGFDVVFTSVKPEPDADPSSDAHHAVEITEHALKFIEANKDRPFFCYVSHHVVHRPLMEAPDLVAKYEAKEGSGEPEHNPVMGAMIERMDVGIGRILEIINALGLEDNTIVIFYSDNGGLEQLQDQTPLRGGKATIYDGGLRVPLAIKWPGVVKPGTSSEAFVATEDLFPTMLDMLNMNYDPGNLDGISFVPVLRGTGKSERKAVYFHYPHYHHQGYKPGGAIRDGDYKLIEWFEPALLRKEHAVELFDVVRDIGETADLAGEMPEKATELLEKLHAWRESVGAQEMAVNPNHDPEKADWRFADSSN